MASKVSRILLRSAVSAQCFSRPFSITAVRCIGEGPNWRKESHTGAIFGQDDYRNMRFVDKDKWVNDKWAVDLIAEDPVVIVPGNHVWSHSCGALGHPKVYINLDKPKIGTCGYSGRKFIQKKFYDEAKHGPSISYEEYLEQMKGDSR